MRCLCCTPFLRLVSLIICSSLVSPYFVLVAANGPKPIRVNLPLKRPKNKPRENGSQQPAATKKKYRDGEVLVRFKAGTSEAEIEVLVQSLAAQRLGGLRGYSGVEKLRLPSGLDPVAACDALREKKEIAFAEPNLLISADSRIPNDPRFSEQWALSNNGRDIGATAAWDRTTGSTKTIIAIIDSGIDFSHPDLANNQWLNRLEKADSTDNDNDGYVDDLHGWDFVADNNSMADQNGHGTAMAGIIAAEGNNAIGISGVMWRAGLMSLQVLDANGTGDVAKAVEAIDYAVNHGAQIINLSWGSDDGSIALLQAIDRAAAASVLVVCSAGNDGRDIEAVPHFPASFDLPNIISVAATDRSEKLALSSNWNSKGAGLAAPGTEILTTKPGGAYQTVSGTSAAAALVSGVAGLVRTLRPWLSPTYTRSAIGSGATQSTGDRSPFGGVLNGAGTFGALRSLSSSEGLNPNNTGNGPRANGGDHQPGPGNGGSGGRGSEAGPRSIPGRNLPDLERIRNLQHAPQTPPAIPSTLPNRNWEKPQAAISAANLLANAFGPVEQFTLPDGYRTSSTGLPGRETRDDSDSQFSLIRALASAAPLPQAQYSSNLALNKTATESSILNGDRWASRAVDGSTNGNFWSGSASATNYEYQPWWQVDLGSSQSIGKITLWPRTDCCPEMLANIYIFVSDQPFTSTDLNTTLAQSGVSNYYATGNVSTPTSTTINRTGRYVRVQRTDTQYLVLAEVQVWASSLTTARLDPANRTGMAGEDLLSGNFNWSLPILGLPGRAGLDLGLTLSYNSLVWTKAGNTITFDADWGTPSPGFRIGFPVIDGYYYSNEIGAYGYVMVTPSGGRVEFRQIGSSTTYETFDSSYAQLINNGSSLLVRTSDGSQMTYILAYGKYRCSQIEDSNGNKLSVAYNYAGNITTITDTLARVITFNYDAFGNLLSITQPWRRETSTSGSAVNETHYWATFGYSQNYIGYNFPGLSAVGPNGMNINVLSQVGLPDGTYFTFQYNSYGQVTTIRRYHNSDNVQRAYIAYDLPSSATDCPRISARRDWADSWNLVNGVATEVVTQYATDSDGAHKLTAPDGTIYKEYYGSGWQSDLVTQAEWWSGGTRQKYTTTAWTQDNNAVTYPMNPRPTETNIYDSASNRRRTTYGYYSYVRPSGATVNLFQDKYEYSANATSTYRHTRLGWQLDSGYLNLGFTGLLHSVDVYDSTSGSDVLKARSSFWYDYSFLRVATNAADDTLVVQHDPAYAHNNNFSWRGNLAFIIKNDVSDPNNVNSTAAQTSITYNTTGSVVAVSEQHSASLWYQSSISYADAFSDPNNVNRNTFAYPTTTTDEENNITQAQYNYDMGVTTWTKGRTPAGNSQGAIQMPLYDAAGRISKTTNINYGAFTSYAYAPNYVQTYSTVTNTSADLSTSTKAYNFTGFDGAGRVIATASSFPQTGLYRGVQTIYDTMGRAVQQSNPTETSASGPNWAATGTDDPQNGGYGWKFTQQAYDWKGRPTVTTNTDNSPTNNSTRSLSYTGCGCAGGEIILITDETGRQQRVTHDVFGRPFKTEVLNYDGSTYSTTSNTYTVLDQVTLTRQFQGSDSSSTYQDTLISYDGRGHIQTQRLPEQTSPTGFSYNLDDTLNVVTDARGATTTYDYNARRLTKSLTYGGGYSAPNVTFTYDAAGNRSSMAESGFGSVNYNYDQISRLTSESRYFNDLSQSFTLTYAYNVGNELTSIAEPSQFGSSVNYNYDQAGQLTSVTGSGGGASTYASGFAYRAWGGVTHMDYGNTLSVDLSFDNRLRPTQYDLKTSSAFRVMGQQYQYDNANRLTGSTDLVTSNLNRGYGYDQTGRLSSGTTANGTMTGPYSQTYSLDVWGNMTNRSWRTFSYNPYCHCTAPQTNYSSSNYSGNRNTDSTWHYDSDGRLLTMTNSPATYPNPPTVNINQSYDAAGRMISSSEPNRNISMGYDGDGARVKWTENGSTTYYIRSSVGDQVITELDQYGGKRRGYIYAAGQLVAKQENGQVYWDHRDPSNRSMRLANASGTVTSQIETDPLGTAVDTTATFNYNGSQGYNSNPLGFYGDPVSPNLGCTGNGTASDCSQQMHDLYGRDQNRCGDGRCDGLPTSVGWNAATARYEIMHYDSNAAAAGLGMIGTGLGFLPFGISFGTGSSGNGFIVSPRGHAAISGMRGSLVALDGNPPGGGNYLASLNQIEVLVPKSKGEVERSLTAAQREIMKDIVGAALYILNTQSDCSKYIQGDSGHDPAMELRELQGWALRYFNGTQFSSLESDGTIAAARGGVWSSDPLDHVLRTYNTYYSSDSTKRIVLGYLYFNDPTVGGYAAWFTSDAVKKARVLTLLHELKHVVTQTGHPPNAPDSDPNSVAVWNQNIYDKCFVYK